MSEEINAIYLNKNLSNIEKIQEIYQLAKNKKDTKFVFKDLNQEALNVISLLVIDLNEDMQIQVVNYIIDLLNIDFRPGLNKFILDEIISIYKTNELNKVNEKIKQLNEDLESNIESFIKKLNTYKDVDLNIEKTMKVLCTAIKLLSFPEHKNVNLQYALKTSYAKYLSRPCFSEEEKIFYITKYLLKNKNLPKNNLLKEYGLSFIRDIAESYNQPIFKDQIIKLLKLIIPFFSKEYSFDLHFLAKETLTLGQKQLPFKEEWDLMQFLLKNDKYEYIKDWALFVCRILLRDHQEFRTLETKTLISNFINHIDKEVRFTAKCILGDFERNFSYNKR